MSRNSANSRTIVVVYLMAALCLNTVTVSAVPLVGQMDFVKCIQSDEAIDCEEKMIFTVPVSFGLPHDLQLVITTTIPGNPEPTTLEEAVQLEISKSPPMLNYPLRYFHTVAYYPHEEIIRVPHPITGCNGCLDCSGTDFPTCGWTTQGNHRLEDSQGFCTVKSLFDLEHGGCSWWRGERVLGEKATLDNPFATAHCLRMGDVFFHGYEIEEPVKSYEIEIKLIQGSESHTITLTPGNPFYNTVHDDEYGGNFGLKAQLLGDLDPYQGPLELGNCILYIPHSPDGHDMVLDYQNNMLLLPREELAKDGGEADKVGISFHAFRALGADSRVLEAGDGLHNQLFHKHNYDLQKLTVNPNAETTYLVHGKRDFKRSMPFLAGMTKILQQKVTRIDNSLISLTTDSATVTSVDTISKGIILEAAVETFTSFSDEGTMNVLIQNIGSFRTNYIVTITECTMNILKAIPAQARSLHPEDDMKLQFDIHTLYNLDTSNECLCTLMSPEGKIYDEVFVRFDTKKHASKYSWEWQEKNNASDADLPRDTTAGRSLESSAALPSARRGRRCGRIRLGGRGRVVLRRPGARSRRDVRFVSGFPPSAPAHCVRAH